MYNVNLLFFLFFTEKIEGSRRGSGRGGPERCPEGGVQVLSTPMGVTIRWNGPVPSQSIKLQARVVQRLDNAIRWINRYPADKC